MPRSDGRKTDQLRNITVTQDYIKHAHGSCLIECGDTKVVCTAVIEDSVPLFLKNSGTGWVTAEYGMLPLSCTTRVKRDKTLTSGRTLEIQRLIGRSLRSVVQMDKLGERTIKIDCDVLQADGGTRTASITGGFIALALAFKNLRKQGILTAIPLNDYVAAISVGVHKGEKVLDLNYEEDSKADMDMNVVMVGRGNFVEVQGTAEGKPYTKKQLDDLLDMADKGIRELIEMQRREIGNIGI